MSPIAHPSPYFPLFKELYSSPQPINSLIKTPLYTIVIDCFIELDIQKNRFVKFVTLHKPLIVHIRPFFPTIAGT